MATIDALMTAGTQDNIINLNGIGEPLLDPDFVHRVKQLKKLVGNKIALKFTTNGALISKELVMRLKDAGIYQIDLSIHRPQWVRRAVDVIRKCGIPCVVNVGSIGSPHNWAGQLPAEESVYVEPIGPCEHLKQAWGHVSAEGTVTRCCLDYKLDGAIGSVENIDKLLNTEYGAFALCGTCHHEAKK
jgi:hypothetical protein